MSIAYIDSAFTAQPARKVWASTSPSAHVVGSGDAFATIALALAAGRTELRLAPGSHATPSQIENSFFARGCGPTTQVTGGASVRTGVTARFDSVSLTGAWLVYGRMGVARSTVTHPIQSHGENSAVVLAGCVSPKPVALAGGAAAVYPPAKSRVGGPAGRRPAEYRLVVEIQAPAYGRGEANSERARWVTLLDWPARRQELTGREAMASGLLAVADTPAVFHLRGGAPVHPAMRLVVDGITYEVVGASQSPTDNELTVFATDRIKGVR